ncbi:MAG TPA: hypothetical protein VKM93_08470 [Terriglobia bacterium]|nr:hypothetical protein [Terriglobia bacterium]
MLNCFLRPQAAEQPPYHNPQLPVEQRVADLLGRMTLEEKVAQAHALWQMKRLIMDGQGNLSAEKSRAGAQRRHRRDHAGLRAKGSAPERRVLQRHPEVPGGAYAAGHSGNRA